MSEARKYKTAEEFVKGIKENFKNKIKSYESFLDEMRIEKLNELLKEETGYFRQEDLENAIEKERQHLELVKSGDATEQDVAVSNSQNISLKDRKENILEIEEFISPKNFEKIKENLKKFGVERYGYGGDIAELYISPEKKWVYRIVSDSEDGEFLKGIIKLNRRADSSEINKILTQNNKIKAEQKSEEWKKYLEKTGIVEDFNFVLNDSSYIDRRVASLWNQANAQKPARSVPVVPAGYVGAGLATVAVSDQVRKAKTASELNDLKRKYGLSATQVMEMRKKK
jgi:hypothetical protein